MHDATICCNWVHVYKNPIELKEILRKRLKDVYPLDMVRLV
jgi:hypothetical protein